MIAMNYLCKAFVQTVGVGNGSRIVKGQYVRRNPNNVAISVVQLLLNDMRKASVCIHCLRDLC